MAEARNEYTYLADGQKLKMIQKYNPDYLKTPVLGSDVTLSALMKGFNQKELDKYKAEAQKAGINVQVVSEVNDIVDYINDKTGGNSRSNDQISSFYYVGHSTPGDLDVGYEGSGQNFAPSDLNSSAFKSGAWVNVVGGCSGAK